MLPETVAEPLDQETECIYRQPCLVELRWLLGEVQGCKLEQPVAMVRHDVLNWGSCKVLGYLEQLLLGLRLLLARSVHVTVGTTACRRLGRRPGRTGRSR